MCDAKDLVPEMVFLLGRMGDNKRALNLIIERLGDVQRVGHANRAGVCCGLIGAIFDRRSNLQRSKTITIYGRTCSNIPRRSLVSLVLFGLQTSAHMDSSAFIRGLLENVGAEIDPIRLIRRIKNGLEIPGLKLALIKILQDFNLQVAILPHNS